MTGIKIMWCDVEKETVYVPTVLDCWLVEGDEKLARPLQDGSGFQDAFYRRHSFEPFPRARH